MINVLNLQKLSPVASAVPCESVVSIGYAEK